MAEFSQEAAMRRELEGLLDSSQHGALEPGEFDGRLESLHARFFGEQAGSPSLLENRRRASRTYAALLAGPDRHHQFERLAVVLGVDLPPDVAD